MREAPPAAGGVVIHQGRVLLVFKRTNGELRLPKGGIDPGETAEQTALREVAEETGFRDLTLQGDLGEQRVRYRDLEGLVQRGVRWFRLGLPSFARQPRSGKDARRFEVRWYDAEAALEAITFDSERAVIEAALMQEPDPQTQG